MTITSTAPTTATPCPVDWCDDAGQHLYADERTDPIAEFNEHTRFCRQETGSIDVTNVDDPVELASVQIAAEVYEDADGRLIGPYVDVADLSYIGLAEECFEVITALARATQTAFPDADVVDRLASIAVEISDRPADETRALRQAQLDFDAAVAEVCDRAIRPQQINQLVAAAIQLQKAQKALNAARSSR